MKRRLILCALAALLSLSALASRPASASACVNSCDPFECDEYCRWRGYAGGFCQIRLCDSYCLCWN